MHCGASRLWSQPGFTAFYAWLIHGQIPAHPSQIILMADKQSMFVRILQCCHEVQKASTL